MIRCYDLFIFIRKSHCPLCDITNGYFPKLCVLADFAGVIFCITVQAKEAIDWPFLISPSTWELTQAGETNYELNFIFFW